MQFAEMTDLRGVQCGVTRLDTIMNEYLEGSFSVTNLAVKMREYIEMV